LPDVLGQARDADGWAARRKEILELYRTEVFGRSPGKPSYQKFTVDDLEKNALGGRAVRRWSRSRSEAVRNFHMLVYTPAGKKSAPLFLGLSFAGNQTVCDDPGIPLAEEWDSKTRVKHSAPETSRGRSAAQWQVDRILAHGYGLATIYYGDIEPDFDGGMKYGVRPLFFRAGRTEPAPDEWGAIAAWAWGLSRAMDYLETDADVDKAHVALFGHTRLGKTALGRCAGCALRDADFERVGRGRRSHQQARLRRANQRPEHSLPALVLRQLPPV
jgi:hypothetical protein